MFLLKKKDTPESYLGTTVISAVVAVPPYFNHSHRRATKGTRTSFWMNILGIISEPSAIAMAYHLEKMVVEEGQYPCISGKRVSSRCNSIANLQACEDRTSMTRTQIVTTTGLLFPSTSTLPRLECRFTSPLFVNTRTLTPFTGACACAVYARLSLSPIILSTRNSHSEFMYGQRVRVASGHIRIHRIRPPVARLRTYSSQKLPHILPLQLPQFANRRKAGQQVLPCRRSQARRVARGIGGEAECAGGHESRTGRIDFDLRRRQFSVAFNSSQLTLTRTYYHTLFPSALNFNPASLYLLLFTLCLSSFAVLRPFPLYFLHMI